MSELQRDNDAAIDFLRKWSMNGPWALTAIDTNRRGLTGEIFMPDEEDRLRAWLDECAEQQRNIYFHVNEVRPGSFKDKARREDIERVTHLHVDIDPRAGEDLAAERLRIQKFIKNPPEGVPLPTWAIFSGGGYQLFWELEEPIEIGGDLNKAEAAKLFNLQLEVLFHADNCHNIDRIMRLAGTINVPDKKKQAKGRTKQLAKVVMHEPDRIHANSIFIPAAQVQIDTGFASTAQVDISGNIERAASIDTIIEWARCHGQEMPEWLQMLIAQGDDPDDPTKYGGDRSKALFAAVCGMDRAKFTDNQMYAVMTDPTWKISQSVLDKGSGIDRYAKRQIERAKEYNVDPRLLKMNEKHAVIGSYGGKCVVIEEVFDPHLKRNNLTKQSFTDFRNRYMHKKVSLGVVNGAEKFVQQGKWWLEHPHRRQYNTLVFSPGGPVPDAYNLWQGFAVEAIPGDCSLWLTHIENNICNKNKEHYEYLLNWMARTVQNPDSPGEAAVILRGRQGTGKGMLVRFFGGLFGRHFMQVSDPKHLVGSFNQHLRDCIVLFGDEAFFAGDKKHEGTLKTLVTEEYLAVEAKGVDVEVAPNYIHLIMASNSDWVVPAGMEERRFFVLDVKEHHMQDHAYFKKIIDQMHKGGRQALLHMLMSRDLSNFNHRQIPQTAALQEQKELSMSPEAEWWYTKLMAGSLLQNGDDWMGRVTVDGLHHDYVNYLKDLGLYRRNTKTVLGRFLRKASPLAYPHRRSEVCPDHITGEDRRQSIYLFPSLNSCRGHWDKRFFKGEWVDESVVEKESPAPF
jgi:hypothetical protein